MPPVVDMDPSGKPELEGNVGPVFVKAELAADAWNNYRVRHELATGVEQEVERSELDGIRETRELESSNPQSGTGSEQNGRRLTQRMNGMA